MDGRVDKDTEMMVLVVFVYDVLFLCVVLCYVFIKSERREKENSAGILYFLKY